jgi:glycosyltransferase involved in cell wall biosynthesis
MLHSAWMRSPFYPWRLRDGPYGWYQKVYTRGNSRWEQQSYTAAELVVAVSEKVRKELLAIGLPEHKVQTIHNGVDLDEFKPGAADRAALNLPLDVPLAFFAGDIRTSGKNMDTILAALAKTPGLHLAVAGDERGSPYLALAQRLGLIDRVHFLGYRRDIADLMRACDLFVFPSRYEACSLVLLEAMASGLPIITAVTTGGSELLDPGCGWILEDPHDVEQLASHMRMLTGDAPLRRRMSANARATSERHSWSAMAGEYVELFERYLGSVSPRRSSVQEAAGS